MKLISAGILIGSVASASIIGIFPTMLSLLILTLCVGMYFNATRKI